jgi:hypothetical protein
MGYIRILSPLSATIRSMESMRDDLLSLHRRVFSSCLIVRSEDYQRLFSIRYIQIKIFLHIKSSYSSIYLYSGSSIFSLFLSISISQHLPCVRRVEMWVMVSVYHGACSDITMLNLQDHTSCSQCSKMI